ncbi:MAG: DUF1800 domain-containing protein [Deltaproteobacteria bacterium]|nr:DUF1800 domain-containing protein [Deltaproteobacteria bacterium]
MTKAAARGRRSARIHWGLALCVCAGLSCSRTHVRPDVTPPLTDDFASQASKQAAQLDPEAGAPLTAEEQAEHLLARVTFGATQADRVRLQQQGIAAFLEAQLHPERLDDSAVDQRIASLPVETHSAAELSQELDKYREDQRLLRERRAKEAQERGIDEDKVDEAMARDEQLQVASATPQEMAAMADESKADRIARENKRFGRKDLGRIGKGPGFDYTVQLSEAKLLRAEYSRRQLQEVMVDFWFNHFNVFAGKDREAALLPSYENEIIRKNALGNFRDLLLATAHSPAMLIYLDNWRSVGAPEMLKPEFDRRGRPIQRKNRKLGNGLNENYARELLELHTLGVDGGYTQADVTEVARCFTGWSVQDPKDDPTFVFRARQHDVGEKHVLGQVIPAGGGLEDGEKVLDLILAHPSTGRFLARKLARRFLEDDPPDAVVERVAAAYRDTQGDIRSMLRALFSSPEFWSRKALKAKMRSPLELVAGAVRALDADVKDPATLARQVGRIGEQLYGAVPPTGYGDTEEVWASSGAVLSRIDFALALAKGELPGVKVDLQPLATGARTHAEVLDRAAALLGAGALTERTRSYTLAQLEQIPLDQKPVLVAQRAVGLLLGAPELQRR